MKSGFTLVEVLIALIIVGFLVGAAVVGLGAGKKAIQMADAMRAVQQCARHARSVALLKQRSVVLTIEEVVEGGVFVKSQISISFSKDAEAEGAGASGGAGFGVASSGGQTRTLSGRLVNTTDEAGEEELNDPLFAKPRVFEGIHIKGILKEETEERRSLISVFSTADFHLRKSKEEREKARAKLEESASDDKKEKEKDEAEGAAAEPDKASSFSVVYEPNGRCDPYFIKLWKDGTDEEKGEKLEFTRFGRVIEEEER